jgi:hypothetical protein
VTARNSSSSLGLARKASYRASSLASFARVLATWVSLESLIELLNHSFGVFVSIRCKNVANEIVELFLSGKGHVKERQPRS